MVDFFSVKPIPVAPAIYLQQPESRISDERLAKIEQRMNRHGMSEGMRECDCFLHEHVLDLVGEIHRLKRENRLLHLSRGEIGLD